ncbi:MAG: 50S ribosomal protein L20 [Rickettsiales bacterium]|jgi:large subunit ribosomal protein L20|nr:50S ribosomal protein L20 [Rickettsiales bacterium]
MTRSTNNVATRAKRKKILKITKGFRGRAKNCLTIARERGEKALQHAYRDRKDRKGNFRSLWIERINAAVREFGITYSRFVDLLTKSNVVIDRKMLSEMAIRKPDCFEKLVKSLVINE